MGCSQPGALMQLVRHGRKMTRCSVASVGSNLLKVEGRCGRSLVPDDQVVITVIVLEYGAL